MKSKKERLDLKQDNDKAKQSQKKREREIKNDGNEQKPEYN